MIGLSKLSITSKRFTPSQRRAFATGLSDSVTPLVAIGTWGFVTGIAMVKSGLSEAAAVVMTILVYAGSAQLTALPLIETNAPLWLIFVAGLVVNVRFVIFGAALQPYFRKLSFAKRFWVGVLISDIVFVLFMTRFSKNKRKGTQQQIWYFLGVVIPGWFVWNTSSILGIYLGAFIPSSWSLDFAAILALLAIVVPLVKTQPMVMCLIFSGIVAWACQPLPLRLGLIVAVIAGVIAGVVGEMYQQRSLKGK